MSLMKYLFPLKKCCDLTSSLTNGLTNEERTLERSPAQLEISIQKYDYDRMNNVDCVKHVRYVKI